LRKLILIHSQFQTEIESKGPNLVILFHLLKCEFDLVRMHFQHNFTIYSRYKGTTVYPIQPKIEIYVLYLKTCIESVHLIVSGVRVKAIV